MTTQMQKVSEVIAFLSDNTEGIFSQQLQEVFPDFDIPNLATRLAMVGMLTITPTGIVLDPFALKILEDLKSVSLMIGEGRHRGELPRPKFRSLLTITAAIEILCWLDVVDDGRSLSDRKKASDFLEPCGESI